MDYTDFLRRVPNTEVKQFLWTPMMFSLAKGICKRENGKWTLWGYEIIVEDNANERPI